MTAKVQETAGREKVEQGLLRRGVGWTTAQTGLRYAVSFATTAVLARLIAPSDFGLVAMASTLTGLLLVVSDGGLLWSAVRSRSLTKPVQDNLFWVNVGLGCMAWVVAAATGLLVARFYGHPELRLLIAVGSVSFVFSGFAVQPMATLQRELRFRAIAGLESASVVAGSLFGIGLALQGAGPWALVGQVLVTRITVTVGALAATDNLPGRAQLSAGTDGHLRFGGYMALTGLVLFVGRTFDDVLVGRFLGAEELGFYGRAYFLMMLPGVILSATVARVAIPALCREARHGGQVALLYEQSVSTVLLISVPLAASIGLLADHLVRLAYGSAWGTTADILKWMAVGGVANAMYAPASWLYTVEERSRGFLLWSLMLAPALALGAALGVGSGAVGVAAGVSVATTVTAPLGVRVAHRRSELSVRGSYRTAPAVLGATIGSVGATVFIRAAFTNQLSIGSALAIELSVLLVTYLTLALAARTSREVLSKTIFPRSTPT